MESQWRPAWEPDSEDNSTGKVLLYGDPSAVHECTSAEVVRGIRDFILDLGGGRADRTLAVGDATTCIAGGGVKDSDNCLIAFPKREVTLVVEVAYVNESWIHCARR
eukprot:jgi/Chrzof1/14403/Cz09g01080.t1